MAGANNAQFKALGYKAKDIAKRRAEHGTLTVSIMERNDKPLKRKAFGDVGKARQAQPPPGWQSAARRAVIEKGAPGWNAAAKRSLGAKAAEQMVKRASPPPGWQAAAAKARARNGAPGWAATAAKARARAT